MPLRDRLVGLVARVALAGALVGYALIFQAGWASGGVVTCANSWLNPGTSGVWDNAGNWSDGIPLNTQEVCLGAAATAYTVTLDNNVGAVAKVLTIQNNATLNIKGTSATALTVSEGVANAGTVVIGQSVAHFPAALNVTSGTFTNFGSVSALGSGGNHLGAHVVNQPSGSIVASGLLFIDHSSSTLTNTGTITANSSIDVSTNASFVLAGGTINGTFPMTIRGGTFEHTAGTVAMTSNGRVNLTQNVTLKVNPAFGSGTFYVRRTGNVLATDIAASETLILEGNVANTDAVLTSSVGRTNNGTIRLQATTNSDTKTAKLNFTTGVLINNGVIETVENPDVIPGTDTTAAREINADLVNNGTLTIRYPTLYTGAANLIQNSGSTSGTDTLDVTGSTNAIFDLEGGTFEGGVGLVGNLLNNGGTVSPGGSAGLLAVSGNFTQGAGGSLAVEIGGSAEGIDSDKISITGAATLGGTLALNTINGFSPPLNFGYTFMTFGSRIDVFDVVTGTNAGNGKSYLVSLGATAGSLAVQQTGAIRQPDGKIALGSGAVVGNDVYNSDGLNQEKSKTTTAGSKVTFVIKIQNDGTTQDKFFVEANGSSVGGYTIKFKRGTNNITSGVNNGTFLVKRVAPGDTVTIKCIVTIGSGAAHGSSVTRLVTLTSGNDTEQDDAVKLTVGRT